MANVASFLKQEPGAIPVTSNQHVQLPFQAAWKTKSTHVEKGDWLEEMFGCLGFRETFLLKEGSVDKEDPLRTANLGPQKDMCWISHQRLLKKWSHHLMARPGQPGQPRGTKTWQQTRRLCLPQGNKQESPCRTLAGSRAAGCDVLHGSPGKYCSKGGLA